MKIIFTVKNIYGIAGETNHLTVEAALNARARREGLGWIVVDDTSHTWDRDFDGRPRIVD